MKLMIALLGFLAVSGIAHADYDDDQRFRLEFTSSENSLAAGRSVDISHDDPLWIETRTSNSRDHLFFTIYTDPLAGVPPAESLNWQFYFSGDAGTSLAYGIYEDATPLHGRPAFLMMNAGYVGPKVNGKFADFWIHELAFDDQGQVERLFVTFTQYEAITWDVDTIYQDRWIKGSFSYAATGVLPGEAIPAVPEPEAYAMLLAGIGLVGVVARRRKSKS